MTMQDSKFSSIIDGAVALILIFIPGLYLIRFSIFGVPTTALEISIYLLSTFCFLLSTLGRMKFILPDRQWLWPISLFFLGAVIGAIVSPDKRSALGQLKGFILDPILLALIIYNLGIANWHSFLKFKISNYLILSGVWLSIWAIIQKLIGQTVDGGRVLSIYQYDINPSPNYLALYLAPLAVMSVISVMAILTERREKQSLQGPNSQVFYLVASILIVIGLFLSGSRGGLLAAGVGTLVGLTILLKLKWLKIGLTCLTILIFLTTSWLARPDFSASPDSGRIASSNNIRWEIWQTTTEILTESPRNFTFGVGLGNYQNYFIEFTQGRVNYPEFIAPKALTPHNIFLAMWANGGLLMLAGLVWLLILFFRSLLGSANQDPNDKNSTFTYASLMRHLALDIRHFSLPLIAAMIALLTHGLVDTPYFKNDLSVEFWLLVAVASIYSGSRG